MKRWQVVASFSVPTAMKTLRFSESQHSYQIHELSCELRDCYRMPFRIEVRILSYETPNFLENQRDYWVLI
jgi:hypothetical protein